MGFDLIAKQASIASVVSNNSRDCGKKKRGNRTAKLKQCKLDARREQWLSQGAVKNMGAKDKKNRVLGGNEKDCSLENLGLRGRDRDRDRENEGLLIHHHDSNLGSLSNSPTSTLNRGVLGGNASRSNCGGSSSSSGGSWSGSITEEEGEGDDDCLDDWEAVADALAAIDKEQKPELPTQNENSAHSESQGKITNVPDSAAENVKLELPRVGVRVPVNSHAWRPDDASRPQCLPNLSKQRSMPNTERQYGYRGVPWTCSSVKSAPSICPICCDDFDVTDAKFLPCLCGFHLCLFCHKRILEEDGRCPGCRKPYEHVEVHGGIPLTRSCSMITRS